MTEPVTPWAEYHRSEWADLVDPLRPPTTDEEPWATEPLVDVLGASELAIVGWAAAVAIVSAALVLVLTALGVGNLRE